MYAHHSCLSQSRVCAPRIPRSDKVRMCHVPQHECLFAAFLAASALGRFKKDSERESANNEGRLHLFALCGITETSEEVSFIEEGEPID